MDKILHSMNGDVNAQVHIAESRIGSIDRLVADMRDAAEHTGAPTNF